MSAGKDLTLPVKKTVRIADIAANMYDHCLAASLHYLIIWAVPSNWAIGIHT